MGFECVIIYLAKALLKKILRRKKMKRTIKFGIFGLGRGGSFYNSILANNGDIVAVCDLSREKLDNAKKLLGKNLATYESFDDFINHEGLEAVFLCNYFHEHTPYAIKALERGIHVLCECASNATMADGVALVRAAEKSSAFFMIAENYPFMKFNLEMRRVYRTGVLGKCLFAEGEYNHPLNPENHGLIKHLRPYLKHWRNLLPRSYYVTHALAPLMHMTGAVPKRVTAMPVYAPFPKGTVAEYWPVQDRAAIITTLNDDDSVFRVTGCAAFGYEENSYRICGERGQIQNVRGEKEKVSLIFNEWDVPENREIVNTYTPSWKDRDEKIIERGGHGGGDFLVIREFFDCIRENRKPDFDEYFATTMASVGILAHRSLLERGVPYDIPDFHKEEDRKKYENDFISPFFGTNGGEPTIACCSHPIELTEEACNAYENFKK